MKTIKSIFALAMATLFCSGAFAQNVTEKIQELSKKAEKGYFYNAYQDEETGNIEITYKFKTKSKDNMGTYETYIFDKNLNLVKQEEFSSLKKDIEDKADYTSTIVWSRIGGCTSFDILNTALHLYKQTYSYTWNKEKKDFMYKKTEDIEIKPKNADNKSYSGYASFTDYNTGNLMVLTSSTTKNPDKTTSKDFVLLDVRVDLSVKEIPLPINASQLVYCGVIPTNNTECAPNSTDIQNGDMFFVFAPTFSKASSTDYKVYSYLRVDNKGNIKENFKINCPSPNLILTGFTTDKDGALYFCGSYNNLPKIFDQLYKEYSPLANPCFPDGDKNLRMAQYEAKTEKLKMDYFCILKLKDNKMEWIKSNLMADITKAMKTPQGQKKSVPYSGNRLQIQYFNLLNNGDIFISGQLKGKVKLGESMKDAYKNVISLQFNPNGEIKAQYSISTLSIADKLNTIFEMPQNFIFSADGQTLYWNLLETKTIKGYANFFDAYNGAPTFYPNYYPSMVKINLTSNNIEEYNVFGSRKYLLNKNSPYIYNEKEKTIYYIGSDKGSKLWLGKYMMK
ncbi:MAG: hypothetical protein WCK02_09985 [Bacteroidota bacterium]